MDDSDDDPGLAMTPTDPMSPVGLSEVQQIIEKVAKKPVKGPNENLFDSGVVDSLSAVNVLVAIEETLKISLNVLDFARREEFTLQHIATLVAKARETS